MVTVEGSQDAARERLAAVADIVTTGTGQVAPGEALGALWERGFQRVLVEGGPSLNAQLLAGGHVDELFVTVTPVVAAGDGPRIVAGDPLPGGGDRLGLLSVFHHDGELLLRYRAR